MKTFSDSDVAKDCVCGIQNLENEVNENGPNIFPWITAIREKTTEVNTDGDPVYKYYTGTLITDKMVVTAASIWFNIKNRGNFPDRYREYVHLASIRMRLSVFRELLSLRCINLNNLSAPHQEEVLRIPKHPKHLKFAGY